MRRLVVIASLLFLLGVSRPARAWDDSLDGTTGAILIGVPVALLLWDGYIGLDRQIHQSDNRTESMLLRDVSWKASVVPFAAGAVAGHWFLNLKESREKDHWQTGFLALGVVAAFDITMAVTHSGQNREWYRHPAIWFGLGLGVGTFSWAQHF